MLKPFVVFLKSLWPLRAAISQPSTYPQNIINPAERVTTFSGLTKTPHIIFQNLIFLTFESDHMVSSYLGIYFIILSNFTGSRKLWGNDKIVYIHLAIARSGCNLGNIRK
jgi:hypothetical protein